MFVTDHVCQAFHHKVSMKSLTTDNVYPQDLYIRTHTCTHRHRHTQTCTHTCTHTTQHTHKIYTNAHTHAHTRASSPVTLCMYMWVVCSSACTVHVLYMYCTCTVHVLYCTCTVHVLYMYCICTVHILYIYCTCTLYYLLKTKRGSASTVSNAILLPSPFRWQSPAL